MRSRWALLAAGLLLSLTACSVSSSAERDTTVDLTVTISACAPGGEGSTVPGPCTSVPVPGATVEIAETGGGELWSGDTESDGTAEARFEPSSDWTLRVTSPFFVGVLESGPHEARAGTDHSMTLSPPDAYVLTSEPGS